MADPDRLRQILVNLLTNAIKFTAAGGHVTVSADQENDRVCIHVSDSGRGIPADRLHSIFEPFEQVERSRVETSQQGVGLGLSISRDLARGMGGDLAVASEAGVGSRFTVTLPRHPATAG